MMIQRYSYQRQHYRLSQQEQRLQRQASELARRQAEIQAEEQSLPRLRTPVVPCPGQSQKPTLRAGNGSHTQRVTATSIICTVAQCLLCPQW